MAWRTATDRLSGRYERWNALLGLLSEVCEAGRACEAGRVGEAGEVSVEEAAERLHVSQATIRRDFEQLARQQLIRRTRGGAVAEAVPLDLPLRCKTAKRIPEKRRIGSAAAALVNAGMAIGLNGGTTITELVRVLAARPDLVGTVDDPMLTVVTNALPIANELLVCSRAKVVVTEGSVRPQSLEIVCPPGEGAVVRGLTLDLVLLGVDAVNVEFGAAAHHEGEAAVNRLMVSRARSVAVVADSSKLSAQAGAGICPIGRIGTLITDLAADRTAVEEFEQAGVQVILA